jgi:hypothetical protein
MMARRYPKEVHDFIRENVSGRTTRELVKITNERFNLGFTESSMKSYKTNHNLRSGTPFGLPKGYPTPTFPQDVMDYILTHHKGVGPKEMAKRLNQSFGKAYTTEQLNSYYGNHHLNSGLTGHFEKGHVPPNKGRKGYCPPGSEKGHFKKGNVPWNHKPVGSERIVDGYVWVKVAEPKEWKEKHRIIWEAEYGYIPEGCVIIFADGDKQNVVLENLMMVTRGELAIMNQKGLISNNPELTEAGVLIADIQKRITEIKRDAKKKGRGAAR